MPLTFYVGDPSPAPTAAGTLAVLERGSFADGNSGSFVRLQLLPTLEMSAHMGLTFWSLTVDGQQFRSSSRVPTGDPTIVTLDCIPARSSPFQADTCGYRSDVGSGSHRVTLTPNLVGIDVQPPPVELTVDLSCGEVPPAADAGVAPAGASKDPGGGCALAGDRGASWSILLVLVSMALVLRRRR